MWQMKWTPATSLLAEEMKYGGATQELSPLSSVSRHQLRTEHHAAQDSRRKRTVSFLLSSIRTFASLCSAQQGKYSYQVRLTQNLATALSDQRASVWIVGRGERNPDPYEEYINFTP